MKTAMGFLLFCLTPLALSQGFDPWEKQPTGLPNAHVGAHLHAVDPNTFWGVFEPWVGSSQAYIRTTNGGATWLHDTGHAAPSKYTNSSIYASDASRAWVAMFDRGGSGGGLFATTDGGVTWKVDSTTYKNAGSAPGSIHFFDANNGVCVGDPTNGYYEIYTTSNGGASWSRVPQANIPPPQTGEITISHEFTAAGSSLWFPTYRGNGRFYRTTDRGLTWSVLVYPKMPIWFFPVIEFQDENVGLCNGDWGDVQKTTDGGVTWTTIPTSMKLAFQDLKYVPNTPGMYVASAAWRCNSLVQQYQYGTLYTLDAGAHWTMASASTFTSPPAVFDLPILSFSTPTSGWQGDASANIYKWTVPSGNIIGVHPDSLIFSTLEVGRRSDTVAVDLVNHASDPVTLSSIEMAGSDFTLIGQPTLPTTLPSLGSARVEICFTPGTAGTHRDSLVFVSSASNMPRASVYLEGRGVNVQSANSWVMYAASTSLCSLNAVTGTPAWIGSLGSIQLTGLTIHPETRELYGSKLGTGSTTLYRIDCGSGFTAMAQTFPVGNMRTVAFNQEGELYGATTAGRLYRLNRENGDTSGIGTAAGVTYLSIAFSPGGKLWASVSGFSGDDRICTVDTATGEVTLVGGTGDNSYTMAIFVSPTGGLFGLKGIGVDTNTVVSIDTLTGAGATAFTTGIFGITSVTMNQWVTTGIVGSMEEMPKACALFQNYPNPFNPSTTIKFELPKSTEVKLNVYDLLGREVSVLVNERRDAGVHEVQFDASGLASGVYLYRLRAGDFISTKRMLILK